MPRTQLATQALSRNSSITPVYSAADSVNGMFVRVPEARRVFVHVKNANAGALTVTAKAGQTASDVSEAWMSAAGDLAVTVPATTGDKMIGPFESARFGNSGQLWLDFSLSASVTVAALVLPS